MSTDLNNLGLGNNSGSISSSNFQSTETPDEVAGANMVDGQIQDSTSSLSKTGVNSSQKQFVNLSNSPTLLAPDENLLSQKTTATGTQSAILEQLKAKINGQGETEATVKVTKFKNDLESQVNAGADEQFSTLLETQDPPLTPAAVAKLKYMYYNGAKSYTGKDAPALQAQLKSLTSKAQTMTAEKFGVENFSFKPDSKAYNAGLSGFYQTQIKQATTNYLASDQSPTLTADEKDQLQQALSSNNSTPADGTTPDYLSKAIDAIKALATSSLTTATNLTGVNTAAIAATTPPVTSQVFTNSIQTINQIVAQGTALVNAMPSTGPSGATKQSYLSLLSQISAAIVNFEQSIYQAQTTTSQSAHDNAIAKLDISLNQIKQNAQKMQEAQAKEAKMQKLGVFAKIFMIIMIVIMAVIAAVIATLTLGTAAPAMAAMMIAIVDAAGPILSGTLGVSVAAAEATEMTFSSIMATAQTIGDALAEAASDIASAVGEAAEEAGVKQALQEAVAEALNPESTTMQVLSTSGDVVNAGGTIVQGGMTIGQSILKANLAILQANADASKTISAELIQLLEKLLKALQGLLSGQSDLINYLSGTATKIIKVQSQISSQITSV